MACGQVARAKFLSKHLLLDSPSSVQWLDQQVIDLAPCKGFLWRSGFGYTEGPSPHSWHRLLPVNLIQVEARPRSWRGRWRWRVLQYRASDLLALCI